jgi:hypothetical protein
MTERKKGGKRGRRRRKKRRFSTGITVVRLRLGYSQKQVINPATQIGAIYVPTKWGGTIRVRAVSTSDGTAKKVRLFYKDGKITNPPTVEEIRKGTHALGKDRNLFRYNAPVDKMGWFFVVVSGTSRAKVHNSFFQSHSLSRRPWNTWYWPGALTKSPHLYDVLGEPSKAPSGCPGKFAAERDGPLIKYDRYKNQTSPATSSAEKEWAEMGRYILPGPKKNPCKRESWIREVGGHCDATAWAGFEETRPTGSKTVPNPSGGTITFTEHDRLGLCISRYWTSWGGEVNNDGTTYNLFVRRGSKHIKANWFHNKLRERIANDAGGIQIHDIRNWNYGIFKYRSHFVGYGIEDSKINKVKIRTRLTFVDWGKASSSKYRKWHGGPNRHIDTIYRLQYKNDGKIEKQLSIWHRKAIKGKTAKEITAVYYANPSAPIVNDRLDKAVLESIYR